MGFNSLALTTVVSSVAFFFLPTYLITQDPILDPILVPISRRKNHHIFLQIFLVVSALYTYPIYTMYRLTDMHSLDPPLTANWIGVVVPLCVSLSVRLSLTPKLDYYY